MSLDWWKRELFGGWTHFEAVWLLMFLPQLWPTWNLD